MVKLKGEINWAKWPKNKLREWGSKLKLKLK